MGTGMWTGIAILALIVALALWYWWRKKSAQPPLVSLVLLLSRPRSVSVGQVRDAISSALGIMFDPDNTEATTFVLELPPAPALTGEHGRSFMIQIPQGMFMMHCASMPYEHSNEERFVRRIQDGRLQRVFREHTGWLSCDALHLNSADQSDAAGYAVIGQIIALFTGDDTLGIVCPAIQRCNEYSPALQPVLVGGNPLAIFEQTTNVPVITIKDDDPELLAAVEEARSRWPEFLAAFTARTPDNDRFSVKVPLSDNGNTEWIWISPTSISDTAVTGTLGNDPNELAHYAYGDEVTIPVDRISDWMIVEDDEIIGGFSLKVLQKAMEKRT